MKKQITYYFLAAALGITLLACNSNRENDGTTDTMTDSGLMDMDSTSMDTTMMSDTTNNLGTDADSAMNQLGNPVETNIER